MLEFAESLEHYPRMSDDIASFRIVPHFEAAELPYDDSRQLSLTVPRHWVSAVERSPHADAAERAILAWLERLGCSPTELERAKRFDIGGYVGIPFSTLDLDQTTRLGKYLALWLLWDDVDVEELAAGWSVDAADVLAGRQEANLSRFHAGWWELMREYRASRSSAWITRVCQAMQRWSDAAAEEAALVKRWRETGELPSFAAQLQTRIDTIGMYGTACHLDEIHDAEPPPAFHAHPIVGMLQYLANEIVGLGNDIFSFAKDHAAGQLNLVSTAMHEFDLSVEDAFALLVRLHDEALEHYDRLAARISPWAASIYPYSERWIQDLRVASLGFTLWEAQAPRYTAQQIVSRGKVLRPRFRLVDPPRSHENPVIVSGASS